MNSYESEHTFETDLLQAIKMSEMTFNDEYNDDDDDDNFRLAIQQSEYIFKEDCLYSLFVYIKMLYTEMKTYVNDHNYLNDSFDVVVKYGFALAKNRKMHADKIEMEIGEELRELSLPNAKIVFEVLWPEVPSEKDLAHTGIDSININFASHSSSKLAPLSKSASGGELSRVMLAIEVVLSSASEIGTFIFDEVDAGVGGKAAIDVGRKLLSVAQSSQVIVVTHLAQVAVWANHHFAITKSEAGDFVESSVSLLTGESRRTETARLLSGQDESESALEHAGELLEMASKKALR